MPTGTLSESWDDQTKTTLTDNSLLGNTKSDSMSVLAFILVALIFRENTWFLPGDFYNDEVALVLLKQMAN